MRILIFLTLIVLVSATANKEDSSPPRSVNVALETSFLFDPKDLKQDKNFVSNIRQFLDKLLKVLEPKKQRKNFRANSKEVLDSKEQQENDTDTGSSIANVLQYVKDVGRTFVDLTGNKIKEAVNNMHVEVVTEKGTVKQAAIVTQGQDKTYGVKEIVSDSINDWMKQYPSEMKTIMNTTIYEDNPLLNSLARRMNTYYNEEDMKKLKKLIKKFKRNIENKQDTTKVVNELLNNAIFKKYSSLNETTKHALMEDLKTFSDFLIANDVFIGFNQRLAGLTRRSRVNKDAGEIRNIDDINYTNLRRSIDNKLKDTIEKNEEGKKKKGDSNGIVVDSVEFLMESARNS